MTLMILGLAGWWATHLFGVLAPGARKGFAERLGASPARVVVALATVASVVAMVIGYQRAEFMNVWYPPEFFVHLNNLLMVIAVFLFIAGQIPSPVRRKIRHPQLASVKTWALAHLLVNGDLASIVLFGGLLAWAVVALIGINRRDGARGALPESDPRGLVFHIGLTAVVFAVITYVHGVVIGVWPLPG